MRAAVRDPWGNDVAYDANRNEPLPDEGNGFDAPARELAAEPSAFAASLIKGDAICDLPPPQWLIEDYLVQDSLA